MSGEQDRDTLDRVARLLMAEWARVEGKPVNVSYIATFADMARAILAFKRQVEQATSTCCVCCGVAKADRTHWREIAERAQAKVARVEALLDSWPTVGNGPYRRGVNQARDAIRDALRDDA